MSFSVCVCVCVARAAMCVRECECVCKYLSCKHIKFTVVGVASAYFKSFSLYSARVYLAHKGSTGETCGRRREESLQHVFSMCVCVCDEHVCKFM